MTTAKIYNFMGIRRYAVVFSALLLTVSVWSLYSQGLVLGLDFSGGTQIEVGYEEPADVAVIRQQLESAGFEGPVVVHFGAETDVLIRLRGCQNDGMGRRGNRMAWGDRSAEWATRDERRHLSRPCTIARPRRAHDRLACASPASQSPLVRWVERRQLWGST